MNDAGIEFRRISEPGPAVLRHAVVGDVWLLNLATPKAELTVNKRKDQVLLLLANTGEVEVESEERPVTRGDGTLLFLSGTDDVVISTTGRRSEILVVGFPEAFVKDLIVERSPETRTFPPAVLSGLIYAVLSTTCAMPEGTYDNATHVLGAMRGVCRAAVAQILGFETIRPHGSADVVRSALEIIASRYPEPDLSIDKIAQSLGISRSTLHAAFKESGMTPAGELRRVRTREALTLRRSHPPMPIQSVVSAVGFGSVAAAYRALRRMGSE
ncbi:Helix-turn-helix domain protein [Microbacterium azadirachtae]|uniref:Helix-turn-helix domain protein n=2 Tax=Microbacterium azadirachtae TaxID=582680 RepID=A0A0F0LNT3_9MICO|nr:Helix-turn-helix domain protein [Microbacterium azadirachtae]